MSGILRRHFSQGDIFLLIVALSTIVGPAVQAITISTVPIGTPGNASDPATGFGSVAYNYWIGKYDVTVAQYVSFLNAVAAADTYNLYNVVMATNVNIAGIARTGDPGNYTYSVINSPNHPITYVGWGDAARFANWLHNGQPTGAQGPGTTERGAYALDGAVSIEGLNGVVRQPGAKWFIPSESEWYKAAYYDPSAGHYWNYPTRTDVAPTSAPPGNITNAANFFDSLTGYAVTGSTSVSNSQNYLTDVGAYTASASPYGTFDQAGNVMQWNEAIVLNPRRGLRGGSWDRPESWMPASSRNSGFPTGEVAYVGFRLATIVEPASPGDFNNDGAVDAADYVLWRRDLGTLYTQNDYADWRGPYFGESIGSLSADSAIPAVPEPSTLALFIVGILSMSSARRVIVS